MLRDPTKVAPTMGEVEEYAEGNRPVKVKECPVGPETLYIAFPVAKSKVEVWLHMELGIVPTGWSYELFWEFLDMQKGAGCNSVTLWVIGPPIGGFPLKEGSSVSKDSKWSEIAQSYPWTVTLHQAPPSMGFSRQEYWSGLPFPSPGHLPNPGIQPRSPAL